MTTRNDIIGDVDRMGLPSDMAAATIALAEFQNGLSVDQVCLRCGKPFQVAGLPRGVLDPHAWVIVCGCGEQVVRGL